MSTPIPGENPELDRETMVPTLIGMSVAFVALSSIIVLLRLYTRYFVVRAPGPDDLTIAMAQILSIGVSIATILQAKYDLGRHVWMVKPDNSMKQLKSLFAAMTIYNLAQILTKASFLFQYRRIFQDKRTGQVCLYLLIFLALWGITQEVLVGFACNPVSIFLPRQASICIDSLTVWYLTSVMNIVTDFIVFLVPLPAIRGLQLPRKQKILVTYVFCLGFFTCVISIVRLFTLHSAINTTDPTWDNVPSAYWSVVELNCGILCASLPPLRPLLRRLNILGMSTASRSDGTAGNGTGNLNSQGSRYYHNRDSKRQSFNARSATGDMTRGGTLAGLYPLTDVETGSQERLHKHKDSDIEVGSGFGSAPYYQWSSPEYASKNSGGLTNSELTSKVEGGPGRGDDVSDGVEGDDLKEYEAGQGPGVKLTVRVTREIDSQSEKKLPPLPGGSSSSAER